MYSPFEDPKNTKEIDRLLSEGEAERRQRRDARSTKLDWLLMAFVVAFILIALTRVAVWLARAF